MKRSLIYATIVICFFSFVVHVSVAQDSTDEAVPEVTETPSPLPSSSEIDIEAIAKGISGTSVGLIVLSMFLGGIGGFGAELLSTSAQDIEMPHRSDDGEENRYDPGFWSRVFLGAITAVLAVYIMSVQDFWSFIAVSFMGGLFSTGILAVIESRFRETITRKDEENRMHQKRIKRAEKTAKEVQGLMPHTSGVGFSAESGSWSESGIEQQETLLQMRDKLNQLQGILSATDPVDDDE